MRFFINSLLVFIGASIMARGVRGLVRLGQTRSEIADVIQRVTFDLPDDNSNTLQN